MNKLYLSYADILDSIDFISNQIKESSFAPDLLISIGRGGMIPTRLLSDKLNVSNVNYISVKLYNGIGTKMNNLVFESFPSSDIIKKYQNILIIDDLVDSGITLNTILNLSIFKDKNIKTATILVKYKSEITPDYFKEILNNNQWVVFPWELHSES